MEASEYIKELKKKVARLNQEIAREEEDTHSHKQNSFPTVHISRHTPIAAMCSTDNLYPIPRLTALRYICTIDGSLLYLHIVAEVL